MPLDIFIPYWGDPDYMMDTVQSVLAQTSDDWLLTVVDDAYPDTTVRDYFAGVEDPRIKYIRKESNEGITANYRTCVSMATQEVITILGSDDVLLPNYVETILEAHKRYPKAAVIQPGVQVIDESGALTRTLTDSVKQNVVRPRAGEYRILSGEALAANLLHGDWLYWPALAFRTDKIRDVEFRDGFPIIQDLALVMDMVFRGEQLLLVSTECFAYRRHTASASSSKLVDGSRFAGEREYFELAATQADELGWSRAKRAAMLRLTSRAHALTLLPKALLNRNTAAAKVLLRHSFGR
ncbi:MULTISPECIES: glycosyltransferase [unclassified Arthrobacter]|uniref:glycosyltransferase family 2 protein n=1 Tax=unclassified Arthrobacter TaxID=235627 RepID=UPI001E504633|nr:MULTISPECIES: glycosyltransferase [unclassified Arthrobacter]MCC9146466.1 glycosyltransferase [Arthrobacter sp. zg-Y919]MDK1277696.1 glycosyltransferase [Arthrobacter sp. zg.Y919]WIB02346.1 glycosyltransferase [Arthrobacter sp. zg-Y919]